MENNPQYKNLKDLAKELKNLIKKMDDSQMEQSDMEAAVLASREIYERLLVLRYKAYEETIKGTPEAEQKSKAPEVDEDVAEESEGLFKGFRIGGAKGSTKNELKPKATKPQAKPIPGKQESIPVPDQPLPFNNPNPPQKIEEPAAKVEEKEEAPIKDESQTNLMDAIGSDDKQEQTASSLSEKLGKTKIEDIHAAIGINQKFLFMNNLFMGEKELYDSAIDRLNAMHSLSEAETYINSELSDQYKWDKESDTYEKFMALVERRYL